MKPWGWNSGGGSSSGASLPDLSPSPAGTLTQVGGMTINAKGLVTAAAEAAGGGGAVFFSPVQLYGTLAESYGLSPGDFLGDYTTGAKYVGFKALDIGGIRGLRYTQDCTYTAKLWIAGVAVATKAAAITAGTPFDILFDTPYTVPVGKGFIISVYDGGTRYSYTSTAPTWETDPDTGGCGLLEVAAGMHLIQNLYAGGDNVPATRSAHRVPLQPIVV